MTNYKAVKALLSKNFKITDWIAVDIIYAAATGIYIPGEMVWLRFVGASRSGKTELLRSLESCKDSELLEVLTPSAIRGGFKVKKKEKKDRLLDRLNGKRVLTYDMAGILTAKHEARDEVFGLLRCVKDGVVVSDFDSWEGHLHQKTRFDWIAGTTSYFEQSRVLESLLGERFVDLTWRHANREEMALRAVENNGELLKIREKLAGFVEIMMQDAAINAGKISKEHLDLKWIAKIGDLAALLRTPIAKDNHGNIISLPAPEVGTDISQTFSKISLGLQLIGVDDYKPHIQRLAMDCMPSIRRTLLSSLYFFPDENTINVLNLKTNLPDSTLRYHLSDLTTLGIVKIISTTLDGHTTFSYIVTPEYRKKLEIIYEI